MSFCCLCLSSLSWGDSRNAGSARCIAGGGGILILATSSSSSMYEIFSAMISCFEVSPSGAYWLLYR